MGSCAAPSAKGDDKFITTDYLQQCPDPVINEPDCHALSVKFLYQLDHIGSVAAKTVELLNQNDRHCCK